MLKLVVIATAFLVASAHLGRKSQLAPKSCALLGAGCSPTERDVQAVREKVKQTYVDGLVLAMGKKRSTAEREAEETLLVVQELKKAILRSHGVSEPNPMDDGLWQGDIMLTKQQAEQMLRYYTAEPEKRDALYFENDPSYAWKMPIRWVNNGFYPNEVAEIQKSLSLITNATNGCITFQQAQPDGTNSQLWINADGHSGCTGRSFVGFQQSTTNAIYMDMGICPQLKMPYNHLITHEVMHALGFNHEHSRNDRDRYVTIQNVDWASNGHNFEIDPKQSSYGVPFNYKGMLLYFYNAFALNPNYCSICPLQDIGQGYYQMGMTPFLEETDKQLLRRSYCSKCGSDTYQDCGNQALYKKNFCSDANNKKACAASCSKC